MTETGIRIAIAHDYLTQRGGAERVVLAMARTFPGAPIYTTLYAPDATFPEFRDHDVRTSWLNRIPLFRHNHRLALPLLPFASSGIHIDADVVLASSSGWAHGFKSPGLRIVYCYSPARWLYQRERYLGEGGSLLVAMGLRMLTPILRHWDKRAAGDAESYLAISSVIQERIRDTYGLAATVVPAPHSIQDHPLNPETGVGLPEAGYFLVVSRLLPYKNVSAVIDGFRLRPHYRLVVVGAGPERRPLMRDAPPNVEFLEGLDDREMAWVYSHAAGLVAASYEDFGLTPLEAAARGKPSAVLRWGGFLDTMIEGETGVFFDEPEPQLIATAVDELARRTWDVTALRARADQFSERVFAASLKREVDRVRTTAAVDVATSR